MKGLIAALTVRMRILAAPALLLACDSETILSGPADLGGRPTIAVTLAQTSAYVGQSLRVSALFTDAAGTQRPERSFVWTLSKTGIVSLAGDGRVLALAPGEVDIIATTGGVLGIATLTVLGPIADGREAILSEMLDALPAHIAAFIAENESLLPRNPQLVNELLAKIAMLQRPDILAEISNGHFHFSSSVRSSNGQLIPVVTVYPQAEMHQDAAYSVGTVELVLPILEDFLNTPFPRNAVRLWYGFKIGATGGGGALFLEDKAGYEMRTPATRLPYDAMVAHELSHSYLSHEALTQFLELYTYNVMRTHSTTMNSWVYTRGWTQFSASNTGVLALLDVYRLIGPAAMARAYRAVYALNPPYGVALSAEARQKFVDEALPAVRTTVAAYMSKVTF